MDIYIDNSFCQRVVDSLHSSSFDKRAELICADKIYNLLDFESINFRNIPVSKQDLKRLIAENTTFKNLKSIEINYEEINSPFTLVFSENSDTKKIRKETECAVYCFDEILSNNDVFFDYKTSHVKEDIQTWGKLTNRMLKFRYIIICDNYLFENDENNIFSLIESLLRQQNKNKRFEILINTSRKQFNKRLQVDKNFNINKYIETKLHALNDLVVNKLEFLNCSMTIMLNEKYHDRHIYTDLQIFESTNSFSLYFNCDAKLHEFSIVSKNNKDIALKKYLPDLRNLKNKFINSKSVKFTTGKFTFFDFI